MSDEVEKQPPQKTNKKDDAIASIAAVDLSTSLAMTRTMLSLDRTMLAWVRTSLALLGFGFTLAKYIHNLISHSALKGLNIDSPRTMGLIMMALGVGGIAGGVIQYFRAWRELRKNSAISPWSPAVIMAMIILIFGGIITIGLFLKIKLHIRM